MTKKYTTKQTIIDEQAQQVEDLSQQVKDLEIKIRNQEFREDTYKNRIKYEARKFADIVCPEASITVYEDHYRPDTPMTVLANIQVFEELFDDEVGGEMKTDLLKEMDKLSEALSAFYSALECEIRINMSINRY
jgi:hypothetical protein